MVEEVTTYESPERAQASPEPIGRPSPIQGIYSKPLASQGDAPDKGLDRLCVTDLARLEATFNLIQIIHNEV